MTMSQRFALTLLVPITMTALTLVLLSFAGALDFTELRALNRWYALPAAFWLAYRSVRSWDADWAKPNHVWHYRALLILVLGGVATTLIGSIALEAKAAPATVVSPLNTILISAVLIFCATWPRPRSWKASPR